MNAVNFCNVREVMGHRTGIDIRRIELHKHLHGRAIRALLPHHRITLLAEPQVGPSPALCGPATRYSNDRNDRSVFQIRDTWTRLYSRYSML